MLKRTWHRTLVGLAAAALTAVVVPAAVRAQSSTSSTTSTTTTTTTQNSQDEQAFDAPKPIIGHFGLHGGVDKVRDANDGRFQGGLHLEFTPGRFIGLQGAVDYRTEETFDFTSGTVNAAVDVRTLPITLTGKLYIPVAPQFSPYGLVGAGWYHQKIDFSPDLEMLGFADRTDTSFGWHLGLGAAAALNRQVGLFGEARWIFLDPNRDLDPATVDQVEDFDFDSSQLMAGVNFFF